MFLVGAQPDVLGHEDGLRIGRQVPVRKQLIAKDDEHASRDRRCGAGQERKIESSEKKASAVATVRINMY